MKITTLLENTSARPELSAEHGLSLYIETAEHRILFDMGQTALFSHNASVLGIDLAAVDIAILSHGHYDHGGGLTRFLTLNRTAPIYVNRHAFEPHYNGTEKYIGLDTALAHHRKLVFIDDTTVLADGITLCCRRQAKPNPPLGAVGLILHLPLHGRKTILFYETDHETSALSVLRRYDLSLNPPVSGSPPDNPTHAARSCNKSLLSSYNLRRTPP